MKTRFVLCLFISMLLPVTVLSITLDKYFAGKKHNCLVVIHLTDSTAIAEYDYTDHNQVIHCKFDTLTLHNDKYKGKFSELNVKNSIFSYHPGNIHLNVGFPDTSYNRMRNLGYLQLMNEKLNLTLGWTGFNFAEFKGNEWYGNYLSDPMEYRKEMEMKYDSVLLNYTTSKITSQYSRVTLRNYSFFPKTYFESSDSAKILKLWKLLSTGTHIKNKMFPYFAQYPISVILLAKFNLDIALLSTPFIYPVLIFSEQFIINKIYAKSTIRISFHPKDKKVKPFSVKVRDSKIIGFRYNYIMPINIIKQIPLLYDN